MNQTSYFLGVGLLQRFGLSQAVVFGIALVGAIILAAWWVIASHKRHRRRHHHWHSGKETTGPGCGAPASDEGGRRRKRRHPHRALNPTLAETRGLPPMRSEDSLPPD